MNLFKKIGMLCLPWFLVACGTIPVAAPVNETVQPPIVKPKVKSESAPVDDAATAPAAVITLLDRAQQQARNGDELAAVGSLERAIRIAPRYPESYFLLGELRYKQGNYDQARSLAQKVLSLGADWWLRRKAQSLVERASSVQ